MAEEKTIAITISRQMASGGSYLGYLLARKLGYKYVEREVLYTAAKDLGVVVADVSLQDESITGFVENLIKSFTFGTPEAAYIPPSRRPIYDHDLFKIESRIIRAIAKKYDTVVVGRGGFSVLRGRPRTFDVFIHAPKEFRIKRLMEFHAYSYDKARTDIEESDKRREKFIRTMTGSDWYDARNYHLSIDAKAGGLEEVADLIIALVAKMQCDTIR